MLDGRQQRGKIVVVGIGKSGNVGQKIAATLTSTGSTSVVLNKEGGMAEMGEIALGLFYQLQAPGADRDGVSADEKRCGMVNSIRSIFGLPPIESDVQMLTPSGETMIIRANPSGEAGEPCEGEDSEATDEDDRYPAITEEDWRVRERARKLLRNILMRQAEFCEERRQALLKVSLAGPSRFERAAEVAPPLRDALLGAQNARCQLPEVRRLTNMLLKSAAAPPIRRNLGR